MTESAEGAERTTDGRAWRWFTALGLAASAIYFLLSGAIADALYDAVAWVGVVAMVVVARRTNSFAWWLMAAGAAMGAAGNVLWDVDTYVRDVETPFPRWPDLAYVASYPLSRAGLVLSVRQRTADRDRTALIDAAIVTAGVGLVSCLFLIGPYLSDRTLSAMEQAVSIGYPLGDVLLLAVAVRLFAGAGRRPVAFRLLGASLVALLVADTWFLVLAANDTYVEGHFVDALFLASSVLWDAAALHPSAPRLPRATATPPPAISARRLVLLAGGPNSVTAN